MKNKKGIAVLAVLGAEIWILTGLACLYHIPAWERAKANHTEAQYQSSQMWPQQEFAKLSK